MNAEGWLLLFEDRQQLVDKYYHNILICKEIVLFYNFSFKKEHLHGNPT